MKAKHQRTLQKIFEKPDRADIQWKDIEALFLSLGAVIKEGKGSRVRIDYHGIASTFHRPHPQKETNKSTIKDIRNFLISMGFEQ